MFGRIWVLLKLRHASLITLRMALVSHLNHLDTRGDDTWVREEKVRTIDLLKEIPEP